MEFTHRFQGYVSHMASACVRLWQSWAKGSFRRGNGNRTTDNLTMESDRAAKRGKRKQARFF
jgi:hypothetical protein